jgi:pimeloyl-ACP methyl ester carboxylesterase
VPAPDPPPGRPGAGAILGSVELSDALNFARANRWAVLTTLRGNGNAEQQPDGSWVWRWARHRLPVAPASTPPADATRYESLWEALSSITVPVLLARGLRPDSVLDDEGERELRRRLPYAEVVHVEEAGHSLPGDTPLELAEIIDRFVFRRFVNDRFAWGAVHG